MKLTLQLKLTPNTLQKDSLLDTIRRFNLAASFAAQTGFHAGVFTQSAIHKLCYREIREKFGLSAQMAVRAIAKAVEAFSRDKSTCPVFKPYGAITYDERILSFKKDNQVSILLVSLGRQLIPYLFGDYQKENLSSIRGQCDLVYRDGTFFLYCTIQIEEKPVIQAENFIGVDLGIVNIATDSAGEQYTGEKVEKHRRRHAKARQSFQRKGTRSAKRRLRKLARKQSRYQKHQNHIISKHVVEKALRLGVGIALEDLKGIRSRTEKTVGKRQRARLSNWSFSHLRQCIEYKALRAGVPVKLVDPRNTSRTCFVCGHCSKDNRKTQEKFSCVGCGHSANADQNAAKNIAARAVSKPASSVTGKKFPSCKAVTL